MSVRALIDAATVVLVLVGAFFFLAGTTGILRFPDFYSRTHAATKCDTVGAGSVLLGLAVYHGGIGALKIVAVVAFLLLASPTAGHALARAAYRGGLRPWRQSHEGGMRT